MTKATKEVDSEPTVPIGLGYLYALAVVPRVVVLCRGVSDTDWIVSRREIQAFSGLFSLADLFRFVVFLRVSKKLWP